MRFASKVNATRPDARESGDWGRLAGMSWQGFIHPGPLRRLRSPDGGIGLQQRGVVESPVAHDDQVRTLLGLAEHLCTAIRAEPAVHPASALRDAGVVPELT